jgi:hypothetical protein
MIRSGQNHFTPGSVIPKIANYPDPTTNELINEYLLSAAWESGEGLLLLGSAGSGKTTIGVATLRAIHRVSPLEMMYWTEQDFLSDLRNLWRMEELTQKVTRDDSLWREYMDWERNFWDLKESPFLFLDDVARGYSPMHIYETENLIRLREAKGLPTIVACQTGLWDNAPSGFTSVIERHSMTVLLDTVYT